MLIVFPAIELRAGRVMRPPVGDTVRLFKFGDDPVAAAQFWAEQGAAWLHVVDLDSALDQGTGSANQAALEALTRAVDVPVQFGGGLRRVSDVEAAFARGAARVVVGTMAVEDPAGLGECLARCGAERVAVGIDARLGQVSTHGWRAGTALDARALARRVARQGVTRVVYTDILRDSMLSGVNIPETIALAQAADSAALHVIAAGGIAGLDDVRRVARAGAPIEGVIVGRALYTGALMLADVLRAAAEERVP
jgi:phosphoribosylformimino-5-aminoimidazole carboxamide ribotide isomerase